MKKMYSQPTTETFDLKSEGLMQDALNPVSSGGSSSDNKDNIYDGE